MHRQQIKATWNIRARTEITCIKMSKHYTYYAGEHRYQAMQQVRTSKEKRTKSIAGSKHVNMLAKSNIRQGQQADPVEPQ